MKRLFAITAMMLVLVIIIVVSTLAPAAANTPPTSGGGGGGGISVGGGVIAPPQSLPAVLAKLDESFILQKGQAAIVTDYRSMRVELKGVVSKSCAAVVGQECPGPEAVVAVSAGESAKAGGASVSVGGGGGAAAGVSPAMPLSSAMPKLVKVLQLSVGESATAFDATISALDVSSDKATFVVSKELYVSDVVDVGITPRSVNVEEGKTATYTITVQDRHKAPECPPGAACSPRVPAHAYKIQVIGLPFETSYQKAVTVAAGEKTEMELTVDTSKKIGGPVPPPEPLPIEGFDLAQYPYQFVKDGEMNALIVVGSQAPASDVVAAVNIATALPDLSIHNIPVAVLDTQVADPFAQNVIAVGTPCVSKVTAAWWSATTASASANVFPPNAEPCNFGDLKEGTAMIKLIEHNGRAGLIVSGTSSVDTRKASRVLADYKEWQQKGSLKGTEVRVTGSFDDLDVRPMPSQPTNEADRAETAAAPAAATGVATSATSAASAVKGTAAYIARKCAASSEDYNKCVAKEEKLDAETSAVSAAKAKAASSTAAVAAKYETYRFAVRVAGEANAVDVAYATLNMLPKQPAAPPTPPTEGQPEEQPPVEVQPVEKVSISLVRGWNLVSLPGKVVTFLPSDCTKGRKLLGFIYLQDKDGKGGGKYVSLQEARRQLGGEFADYLSKHAFWVYSYNGCTFDANVKRYVSYDELSLQPGWNLLPINVGMVGKNLNELNVNCDFTRLFTWDSSMQSWNRLTQGYVFSQTDANAGFVAKTENYCEFGGELTISPPDLPD